MPFFPFKKNLISIVILLFLSFYPQTGFSQISVSSMETSYRTLVTEPGKRNIILQNRCGNRLSIMLFEDSTGLEFVYKPNAFRRKDFNSRNFSNRDNFTLLFSEFSYQDIKASYYKNFNYDPFFTSLDTETPHGAKNTLGFLNIADENLFALTAKAPLLIRVKPHVDFIEGDGLLLEKFHDRGEDIISFIRFQDYEHNRFRRLKDGSYIIQIFENDVILAGGEENMFQINRILHKYEGKSIEELYTLNEQILEPDMDKGILSHKNQDIQKVIDVNHRIVYSGMDAGGACFGSLNRIYHLIWVRDGSMTSALMARAGNPELIKLWTPFLLANPSYLKDENGVSHPEFLQLVGTRWTKTEPDGIYFAVWSLFSYLQNTGQDDLLYKSEFDTLLSAMDYFLEKNYNREQRLIITDTQGETPLKGNPYFGYDVVNGNFERNDNHVEDGKAVVSTATFYNNVNTWNALKMLMFMLEQRPDLKAERLSGYQNVSDELEESLLKNFTDRKSGIYKRALFYFDDGSSEYAGIGENPWELSWAVSLGPFFPDLNLAINTAKAIKEEWGRQDDYGYCPWNCLANILYEYGMDSKEYEKMQQNEIKDALMLSQRYPMPGALTEYRAQLEGWRALPFSAGSFFFSISGQILQNLPMGLAVRASDRVDSLLNYQYQLSKIQVYAKGSGDVVGSLKINGSDLEYSLQIPSSRLKAGQNYILTQKTEEYEDFRLYASSAELKKLDVNDQVVKYQFYNPLESTLIFENLEKVNELLFTGSSGESIPFVQEKIKNSNKSIIQLDYKGEYQLSVKVDE